MTANHETPLAVAASLTRSQRFVLEWLSKADSSALGECKGADLDELVSRGLAWIAPIADGADRDYARVSITVLGASVAREL